VSLQVDHEVQHMKQCEQLQHRRENNYKKTEIKICEQHKYLLEARFSTPKKKKASQLL